MSVYPAVRRYPVAICDGCIALAGAMCSTPGCVFWARDMRDVGRVLDDTMIRPVIDGERADVLVDPLPDEVQP